MENNNASDFPGNAVKTLASGINKTLSVVIVLTVMFALINLLDWYKQLIKLPASAARFPHGLFLFKISPIISLIIIILEVIIIVNQGYAWRDISEAFNKSDSELLNKGLVRMNWLFKIYFISLGLSVGVGIYRFFIM